MTLQPALSPAGIPKGPEDITPEWLTIALRSSGVTAGASITSFAWESLGAQAWTTCLVRLSLAYDRALTGPPATLVAKFSAQETSTRRFFGRFYQREVFFYGSIAGHLRLRVPHCYYADYDRSTQAHILLLEDMAPAVAGDSIGGVNADVALEYTRQIATLHAQWWQSPRLDALLACFPAPGATFAQGYGDRFANGIEVMRPYLDKITCGLARRLQNRLQERWRCQTCAPRTLIQWDAHAANLTLPSSQGGAFAILDWQNWTVARGIWDVARFCILSLPIKERRVAEPDIVALYVQALTRLGVRDYSIAQAMADYQNAMALQFAQQLRFFGSMQHWDDERRTWVAAITPRVVAALHDADALGILD